MTVRCERRITRGMLRAEPQALFVFGDNLARTGLGGQAREMRGEPNAVGIPTKARPVRHERAYFNDGDFAVFVEAATPAFARLRAHLEAGGTVVLPEDGIGTGLAELPTRALRIWASLQRALDRLKAIADAPDRTPTRPDEEARGG